MLPCIHSKSCISVTRIYMLRDPQRYSRRSQRLVFRWPALFTLHQTRKHPKYASSCVSEVSDTRTLPNSFPLNRAQLDFPGVSFVLLPERSCIFRAWVHFPRTFNIFWLAVLKLRTRPNTEITGRLTAECSIYSDDVNLGAVAAAAPCSRLQYILWHRFIVIYMFSGSRF